MSKSAILLKLKGNAKVREECKNIEIEEFEEDSDDDDTKDADFIPDQDEEDCDEETLLDQEYMEEIEEDELEDKNIEGELDDENDEDFEIPNIDDEIRKALASDEVQHHKKLFDEWMNNIYFKNVILNNNALVVPKVKYEEIMRSLLSDDHKEKAKK